jgi:hypothetical protein
MENRIMALSPEEQKIFDALKAKQEDPEETQHKKRLAWIDKQIEKEEKAELEAKDKEEKDKQKKKFRFA